MSTLQNIQADLYRIPLPVVLSDSTHGDMTHFELVTVRLRDDQGAEGVGYPFTVGANGRAALHALREPHRLHRGHGKAGPATAFRMRLPVIPGYPVPR